MAVSFSWSSLRRMSVGQSSEMDRIRLVGQGIAARLARMPSRWRSRLFGEHATLAVPDGPYALAVDASGNLYVDTTDDTVTKFAPGATTASATLTGLDGAIALAVDGSGNLYVANSGDTTVSKFAPGHIDHMIKSLLPDMVGKLEPFWADFSASGGAGFGDYLAKHGEEVAQALLSVTDARAEASSRATIVKAYNTVRGSAIKHVKAALPALGALVQKYAG